jgi:hypothetical protein
MAYDEYNIFPTQEEPPKDIPIRDVLRNIVSGFENKKNYQDISEAATRVKDIIPNVTESLGRGGFAQAGGVYGDIRDLRNTVNSYQPKSLKNITQIAEFLSNPYLTSIVQSAPTTEKILKDVPRMTDAYEGYKQHETLGEFIGSGIFGVGKDLALATKGMPVGLSMIGPESKLWKKTIDGVKLEDQAFKAQVLESKGKLPEEIYKDTGMVRGLDGQWRKEITDFWSSMKGDKPFGQLWQDKHPINKPGVLAEELQAGVKVGDVFEHPELFKHYPELAEIKIKPHSMSEPYRGEYNEGTKTISLRENLTPEEARSVLHHELTHGIQGVENWNRGGNVQAMADWIARQGEVKTKMAEANIRRLSTQLVENPNVRNTPDFMHEWNLAHDQLDKAKQFSQQDPYEAYKHLGGEAEARMVQKRLGLTEDQLKEHFPFAEGPRGLDINPDLAKMTGYEPGVINTPNQSIEKPYAVSTRVPTAVKATEDALKQPLLSDYKAFRGNQEAFLHNVDLIKQYPNLALKSKNADVNAEKFIEHVKDNLLFLHDKVPADTRARSKLWYEGANKIANEMSKDYGISEPAASGILAVLSPQKDWFMNVSLGERVASTLAHKQKFKWDSAMSDVAREIYGKPQYAPLLKAIEGKRLEELKDPLEKAVWIRTHDQAHNPREHFVVTSEGDFNGVRTKANGEPAKTGWGSNNEIAKAVSIFDNPTRENIHARLGGEHKVRNFYNNIYDPFSELGHTTIDTHAVAAGLLRPLSGNTREVSHNFGSNFPGEIGPKNSAFTGKNGTYGLYHEGYKRAAKEREILPREMQSITWEAVRGLFPDTFKNAKNVQEIEDIWKKHKSGKIDIDETRKQILEKAGGINEPEWKQ